MVGWGKAFRGAVKVTVFAIIWYVIALSIALFALQFLYVNLTITIALYLLAAIVGGLGVYASIIKVAAETAISEAKRAES